MKKIKYNYYKDFDVPSYTFSHNDQYVIKSDYGMGYRLIINPFLNFYGETILYHDNSSSEDQILIKDYGLLPSLRKINYDPNILPLIESKIIKKIEGTSFLESHVFSDFLSEYDINYLVKSVIEIKGIGMIKILPKNYSDYKNLNSSKIKILQLPLKDLDYQPIPLDLKINQTVRLLKREKAKNISHNIAIPTHLKLDILLDNDEFTYYFDLKEYFEIEPYKSMGVKHLIKNYTWQDFSYSNVRNDIQEIFKKLNITLDSGNGFVLLLTKNYLFVAPLTSPYANCQNIPLFAEPNFFAGIYNLPQIEADWPETTLGEFIKFDIDQILIKSTN